MLRLWAKKIPFKTRIKTRNLACPCFGPADLRAPRQVSRMMILWSKGVTMDLLSHWQQLAAAAASLSALRMLLPVSVPRSSGPAGLYRVTLRDSAWSD